MLRMRPSAALGAAAVAVWAGCKEPRADTPPPAPVADAPASSEPEPAPPSTTPVRWDGTDLEVVWEAFESVFPTGNRNAASHRWASYVLDHASRLSPDQLRFYFQSFCPVSGSIVRPRRENRFRVSLPMADGTGEADGYLHFCCWPCVCDTMDFIHVDTKTVETRDGPTELRFVVIGDPCENEEALEEPFTEVFDEKRTTLREVAPELTCDAGKLAGATFSDEGHVIIGLLHDGPDLTPPTGETATPRGESPTESVDWRARCEGRAEKGYRSGMGAIFREAAQVTPVRP